MLRFRGCVASTGEGALVGGLEEGAVDVLFIFEDVVSCDGDVVSAARLFNRRL